MIKLVILLLFSFSLFAKEEILISIDGKKKTSLELENIKQMKSQNVEFFNFVTKRAELYKGVPFLTFIEKVVPEVADQIAEIEFKAEDGYKSYVNKQMLEKVDSILSYKRADGDTFTRFSQKRKMLVNVGPLYHLWDLKNISKEERLNYSSVYQIREINFITNNVNFGVQENSVDASIYLGYQTYKRNCISCHSIGKIGGETSFDLIKRKTLENKQAGYVLKYILDPQAMNPKSQMLPLPKFKNRIEMAQGIVDFLKFMQNPEVYLAKKEASASSSSYQELKKLVNDVKHGSK